ncbi:MAG TPA: hypothetical protein VIM82_05540 [Sulfurimonas sp.]
MKDFSIFKILPTGVMIFKNQKVEFINQHILDVLSIGYFSTKNAVELIVKILDVKDEQDLFLFLSNHDYFDTRTKRIQIEHSRYEDYDVFTFARINDSIAQKVHLDGASASKKADIDEKVAKLFKLNNVKKVKVMTLYKGVPLKNYGKIIRVNMDSIEVIVEPKHRISLLERDDILLIVNTKKGTSVLHGEVVKSDKNVFTIKNFYLSKEDVHLRDGLRVKLSRSTIAKTGGREFEVYDVSMKGISIKINSSEEEEFLKERKFLKLFLEESELHLNLKYLKTVKDNGKILKIIFLISLNSEDTSFLNQFIVKRQNEILREIHEYDE